MSVFATTLPIRISYRYVHDLPAIKKSLIITAVFLAAVGIAGIVIGSFIGNIGASSSIARGLLLSGKICAYTLGINCLLLGIASCKGVFCERRGPPPTLDAVSGARIGMTWLLDRNNTEARVQVERSKIHAYPQDHLKCVATVLRYIMTGNSPRFRVSYQEEQGIDQGALSRQYIYDLLGAITTSFRENFTVLRCRSFQCL